MDSIPGNSLCIMADSLRSFFAGSASASLGRVDHTQIYARTRLVVGAILEAAVESFPR